MPRRVAFLLLAATLTIAAEAYDPLAKEAPFKVRTIELTATDSSRSREIPLLAYLPALKKPAPVILFSHGLGGSRHGNAYLGEHWSARGYVVVFVQHPGSDDAVWKAVEPSRRMAALRQAANARNFQLRVKDIPFVLDELEKWNLQPGHPLEGRLDMTKVGMSGHSFGAITTQAVSGQHFGILGARFTDKRIRAAVAFSQSAPKRGNAKTAFGSVEIPWMLMTGTKDVAVIGNADLASRLAVFPALPEGDKYEVVLYDAEHSAFSDRALPGDREARNPNHHRAILARSTAFWDGILRGDRSAKAWLKGSGPASVLKARDRWLAK